MDMRGEENASTLGCPDSSNRWHLTLKEDAVLLLLGHTACTEILEAVWTADGPHGKLLRTHTTNQSESILLAESLIYTTVE